MSKQQIKKTQTAAMEGLFNSEPEPNYSPKVSIKVEYKITPEQTISVGIERELAIDESYAAGHSELYINCLETISTIVNDLKNV